MHIEEIGRSINFHLKNIAFSRFKTDSSYKNIISPFSRLYLVTEGNGYLVFNGVKTILEPNFMYLIPSFTPCSYIFNKGLSHFYIHFSMEMPSGLNIYQLYNVLTKIKSNEGDQILFQKCLDLNPGYELPHHDPKVYQAKPWVNKTLEFSSLGHYLETTGIIKQLFSGFLGHELTADISKISDHNLQNILAYIQDNLTLELSVSDLAELSFTSKDHFSRVFKSITGMPPSEFIIRKRLEKAKLLLLTTNNSLSEIIAQTGFRTTAYFCRMFKKYTSLTPEQFRKNRG